MSFQLRMGGALTALVFVLAACGGGPAAPTGAPATQQPATQAPATDAAETDAAETDAAETDAAETDAAETDAAETEPPASEEPVVTPEPTPPPATTACAGGGEGGELTGELTLWHSYGSGAGTESEALNQGLAIVCGENPGLKVDVVGLDFGSLFQVYRLQALNGDPDLFIAPNDSLWELAEAGLLENVADRIDTASFSDLAIQGSTYTTTAGEEGIWQVPESLKAVALYYNADTVETPPATTDELTAAVEGGTRLGLLQGIYHNFGWWGAFGGQLMDETGRCIADQGGVADAFQYMADLEAAGATFYPNYDDMAADFKAGELDMIVDGPWAAGGYVTDVENLGVAPMPAGPAGPALPMTGVDGWNINPLGDNVDLAVAFANRMVEEDIQAIYANVAYHIPSNPNVPASENEVSAQFAEAVVNGALRPQRPELGGFWDNFGNALNEVIDNDADPAAEVAEACQAMNDANGL